MAVTEASLAAARALDDLYRRHGPEIYRYALAVLGNHADAEDVTQTTFLNAYRALEQGVHPRKPLNWLLTIASNSIKQRFRQEQSRPNVVALDRDVPSIGTDDEAPSVGELLTALAKIPPQQRQALVLREFEGRSYKEIAEILSVTTSALETLLFRARRSLTEELTHQLTCVEAQQTISRAADRRLGRKEKRRLEDHVAECPDCAQFARLQHGHRKALRGLALVPVPLSLTLFKGFEGSATAATLPAAAGAAAAGGTGAAVGSGMGGAAAGGGGLFAGGLAVKAAAIVAAAGVAGGVTAAGVKEIEGGSKPPVAHTSGGRSHEPHARRAAHASATGLARGKARARGQAGTNPGRARGHLKTRRHAATNKPRTAHRNTSPQKTHAASRPSTHAGTRAGTRTRAGASSSSSTTPKTTQSRSTQTTRTRPASSESNGSGSSSSESAQDATTSTSATTTDEWPADAVGGKSAEHSNRSDH